MARHTRVGHFFKWPVPRDLFDLEHILDGAHLETIVCKFGRNGAICLVEAICAKCLQTDRQTDRRTDGRTDGWRDDGRCTTVAHGMS